MLKKYRQSSFLQHVVTMMSGTVLAQIMPLVLSPVMARLYGPKDYGIFGLYMATGGILNVFVTSHYNHAIMLPADENESANVAWLCVFISGIVSIIVLFSVLVLKERVTAFFQMQSIVGWLYCLPLTVMLSGSYSALNYWTNRKCQYQRLALSRIAQAAVTLTVQISLGIFDRGPSGLLFGLVSGQAASTLLLLARVLKDDWRTFVANVRCDKVRAVALKHRSFAYYLLPADFINTFNNQVPTFLLTKFANAAEVGKYNFTQRILGLPVTFISGSLVDVFKQRAISDYNKYGNCEDIYKKTFKALVLAGLIPFLVVILRAPEIFEIVFGERWKDAGVYAQILSVMFYLRMITSPLSYMYYIVGKQREDFLLHVVMAAGTGVSLYLGYRIFGSPKHMVLLFSLSYAAVYCVYLARSYAFCKGSVK